MANSSRSRLNILRAMRFAAAVAIVLWPACTWAQSESPATFTPSIAQKLDARSAPAKVTTEDESALTNKGYVKIGTIKAAQPGKKIGAEVTEGLRAAALSRAAEAGGDIVHFAREGVVDTSEVPTGKMMHVCGQEQQIYAGQASHQDCSTDIHGFQHCITMNDGPKYNTNCLRWDNFEEKKRVDAVVSEGTVWRYDHKLAADIARAEAARNADTARAEAEARAEAGRILEAEALGRAAYGGNKELVEGLLANGFDVNSRDSLGMTALHRALQGHSSSEVLESLLAHGADVNAKDHLGETPLSNAVGNYKFAELLLAHGADVKIGNNWGCTPLHAAAYLHSTEVPELLLAHGADVNAKETDGQTPLHIAAKEGNKEVAELLLAHGAAVNARNEMGDTPMRLAKQAKLKDMVKLLRQNGGHE